MILVSACLLGLRCRYDGTSKEISGNENSGLLQKLDDNNIAPVCPEQMGGLPTPREPATLEGGDGEAVLNGKARVLTESGKDVTEQFLAGTEAVLRIAAVLGADKAILKENSPSCGVLMTYVDGHLTSGKGVTAAALTRAGIPVISDKTLTC